MLQRRKCQLMEETDSAKFRIGLWLALAVDGSRLDAPRTQANERQFCKQQNKKQSKKKKKRGRHARTRQPVSKKSHYNPQPVGPQVWLTLMWHIGMRMPWAWGTISGTRSMNRTISSFAVLAAIVVSSRSLDECANAMALCIAGRRTSKRKGVPPLVFRLLRFNDGRGEVCLVTNELNPRTLSDPLAGKIYRQRWRLKCFL